MTQQTLVDAFAAAIKGHDWNYSYADDHKVYRAGQTQANKINEQYRQMTAAGLKATADNMIAAAKNRKRY